MIIYADWIQDLRYYNAPIASKVAAIMVDDGHELHIANVICNMRNIEFSEL